MLYVGIGGLAINLIGLVIFGHGHSHGVPAEAVKKLEELERGEEEEENNEIELKLSKGSHSSNENVNNNKIKLMNDDIETTVKLTNNGIKDVKMNEKKSRRKCCAILCKLMPKCRWLFNRFLLLIASEANVNIRAVFLHVLADALGSVIAITSALLNKYNKQLNIPEQLIRYIDPSLW